MTQLIYNDGSQSDTTIEVKLRHPGTRDRNVVRILYFTVIHFILYSIKYTLKFLKTKDHNWAIFVNPVGVDATVKTTGTRCVAGGYRWNPYYTQLADPLNVCLYSLQFLNIHKISKKSIHLL